MAFVRQLYLSSLESNPLMTKCLLEGLMRFSSGVTGQVYLNGAVTSMQEAVTFGLYGSFVTGPFNSWFNNFTGVVAAKTNDNWFVKLLWANLVHTPLVTGLLLSYKAAYDAWRKGGGPSEIAAAVYASLAAGWFNTMKAVW